MIPERFCAQMEGACTPPTGAAPAPARSPARPLARPPARPPAIRYEVLNQMSLLESEIRDNSILRRDLEELVRERFGYTLNRPDSPHEIVKLLRLDELEREIHWRKAKLLFDGSRCSG